MKQIIKHGYKKDMRTTCPMCGCEFSYEWEDVITTYSTYPHVNWAYYGYGDGNYSWTSPKYEIICPDCGKRFQILNWTISYPSDNTQRTTITYFTKEGDNHDTTYKKD